MKTRPINLLWIISLLAALTVPSVMLITTVLRIELSERWCMILLILQLLSVSVLVLSTHAQTRRRSWLPFR